MRGASPRRPPAAVDADPASLTLRDDRRPIDARSVEDALGGEAPHLLFVDRVLEADEVEDRAVLVVVGAEPCDEALEALKSKDACTSASMAPPVAEGLVELDVCGVDEERLEKVDQCAPTRARIEPSTQPPSSRPVR